MVYDDCLKFAQKYNRWPRYKLSDSSKKQYETLSESEKKKIDDELKLGKEWRKSEQYNTLIRYRGIDLSDISNDDENKEMIALLRSYGLGLRNSKKIDVVEEYLAFYTIHKRHPKRGKDGKKTKDMEKLEHEESKLYQLLMQSKEYKLLNSYRGVDLESIPKEHYEMVKKLREIGLGLEKIESTTLSEYVNFIKTYHREPSKRVNPKEEEIAEANLRQRWKNCKEKIIFDKYKGVFLEDIPDEKDREIVKAVREAIVEIDGDKVSDDIIRFVNRNKREPMHFIDEFNYFKENSSKRRKNEGLLREKWDRCFEKQVLERYRGIELEDIPKNYRRIVKELRAVSLGLPETLNTRIYINFVIKNGRRPKQCFHKNGLKVDIKNYTLEQKKEALLRHKWDSSEDKQIYTKLRGVDLDELPEEYKMYRTMLQDLREIEDILYQKAEKKKSPKPKTKRNIKAPLDRVESIKNDSSDLNSLIFNDSEKTESDEEKFEREKIEAENLKSIEQKIKESEMVRRLREVISAIESEDAVVIKDDGKKIQKTINQEKKAAKDRKIAKNIEIAKKYIEFIKKEGRDPKSNGALGERQLYLSWKKCSIRTMLDEYAGIDISGKLNKEEEEIILEFRRLGYGLTFEEYYEKFREINDRAQILKGAKKTCDNAKIRNAKAKELEERAKAELRKRGVSKDD